MNTHLRDPSAHQRSTHEELGADLTTSLTASFWLELLRFRILQSSWLATFVMCLSSAPNFGEILFYFSPLRALQNPSAIVLLLRWQ